MRPALSGKLAGFGTTIFTEMTRLANERGAINLAQGFPDFDGPEFAKDAAIAAIRAGDGRRGAAGRDAPSPRLAVRARGAGGGFRKANAGPAPQHAPQSDGESLLGGRALADGRALPGARRLLRQRRGLRASRLRRTAP